MLPVEEQLKVITSGTMQIVPLDELKKKLERGVPLNIKLGVDQQMRDFGQASTAIQAFADVLEMAK